MSFALTRASSRSQTEGNMQVISRILGNHLVLFWGDAGYPETVFSVIAAMAWRPCWPALDCILQDVRYAFRTLRRMALGASAGDLQARIIAETLALAAVGMFVGAGASLILGRLLSRFLFGVTAADPATFVAMLAVLTFVAVLAGYLPARRASRIDPMVALRAG